MEICKTRSKKNNLFGLTIIQTSLLFFLVIGLGALLLITITASLVSTLFLLMLVTSVGLWLCHQTYNSLKDSRLKILDTFWLLKIIISIILLYLGWIPELDPSSGSWGYDPQRYYLDSFNLIQNAWQPTAALGYQGIVYYYGLIFYLFGYNPVIPLLINNIVTLICTLYLIRYIYSINNEVGPKDWTIAYLLMIPDVLWYDTITSREMILVAGIILSTLPIGKYLIQANNKNILKNLLISGVGILIIIGVRATLMIPLVITVGVFLTQSHKRGFKKGVLIISFVAIGVFCSSIIQGYIGGVDIDYSQAISSIQSFDANVASNMNMEWGENSIGLLIKPNNIWEAFFYTPIRMVLYLVAPLPNIGLSVEGLIGGSWLAWQQLMATLTSILIILLMPFVLSGTAHAWNFRHNKPSQMIIVIIFWVFFFSVAGGNIIIHERYRVMFMLLLFSCACFGYSRSPRSKVYFWGLAWYFILFILAIFFIAYKFLL